MGNGNNSLIGQQLGIYQVQAHLGQGGMAQVYKAYHTRLRREVAIKVIRSEIAERAGFRERFEREAQMIASLQHPNIVSVYDFGEEGDLTYLVMQYVGGGTLRDQLRERHPLESSRAIRYASQMALALHHAHQRSIVHRDVKPQNMLISSTDPTHLLLSDFGIAKLYYQNDEAASLSELPTREMVGSTLTSASQIIGTADYMSPEQANGQAVDARTDVYALGVVLYQMLTGEMPFRSTTLQGLLFQHIYTPPPSVRTRNPHVPEILAQITARALAKAPADRFQSAEAMARALEQANVHATLLTSSAPDTPVGPVFPPTAPNTSTSWTPPTANTLASIDSYATASVPPAWSAQPQTTSMPPHSRPTTNPQIKEAPHSRPTRRLLPLSYLIAALFVVVGLVVLSLRFLPSTSSNGPNALNTPLSNSGLAQAFNEQFQDNHLNWQTGNIAPGVSISTPGQGAYAITIASSSTAFPYPQAVGLLPDNFTLTATLQQTAGASDDAYGLAFHFARDNSGSISCYALAISSNGSYAIYEYTSNTPITITQGSYPVGPGPHTLTVKAQGNLYTFSIDQQALQLTIGTQAPTTTWSNNDLHSGHPALLFAGPNPGEANTAFKATHIQLSTTA
jgi:serine/threonine protein kinase